MNIFVVEDSELIRTQLVLLLQREPAFHVIGMASTEAEAVESILSTPTHAVLLDLSLESGNGLHVLKRARAAGHQARFLILSNKRDSLLRDACMELGACGYYDKNTQIDACLEHLRSWTPLFSERKAVQQQQHPAIKASTAQSIKEDAS